jgi:hypothetical protein
MFLMNTHAVAHYIAVEHRKKTRGATSRNLGRSRKREAKEKQKRERQRHSNGSENKEESEYMPAP